MSEERIVRRKKEVRERIKELRSKLSESEVAVKSAEIKKRFFNLPEFKRAKMISFYVSKENEVRTEGMIKDSIASGKRVLVPIVDKKSGRLVFSELKDYDAELDTGAFGVPEPKPEYRRPTSKAEIELVAVPGVAFDKYGNRLGHGKGYYDRFLREVSLIKDVPFIGLAYEFQVLEEVPHNRSDVSVHKIITEKRAIIPNYSLAKKGKIDAS